MVKYKRMALGIIVALFILTGCATNGNETKMSSSGAGSTITPSASVVSTEASSTNKESSVAPSTNPEANIDYSCYYELIEKVKEAKRNPEKRDTSIDKDVSNILIFLNPDYETQGYTVVDIDGDGVKELLFGANGTGTWDNIIYGIYTIKDGRMFTSAIGWEKNRFYLCGDGIVSNEGSSGAAVQEYLYYNYSGQRIGLDTEEHYEGLIECVIFDAIEDENNPWFYSTNSGDVKSAGHIDESRAKSVMDKYKHQKIQFTPFI